MIANAAEDYIPYRWEVMAERYQQLLLTLAQEKDYQEELINVS